MQQAQTAVNATRNVSEDAILADLMSEMEQHNNAEAGDVPVMTGGMITPEEPATAPAVEPNKPAAKKGKGDRAPAVVVSSLPSRKSKKTAATEEKHESKDESEGQKPVATPAPHWPFPTGAAMNAAASTETATPKKGAKQQKEPEAQAEVTPNVEKLKTHPALRNPFAKKSEKIMAKLGDKAADYLIMETADALLSPEELEAKRVALLADLDNPAKTAKKVGEKAVQLFGWVRNGGKLNEYMHRAFKVLSEDGHLASGIDGNLQKNYLARPYAPGTASAQANQIFQLFPLLKLTIREKGRMVPNPDSVLLTTILTKLGLTLKTQ